MTKLDPEWVRTSDPVIRSPARYRWTTAPAQEHLLDLVYWWDLKMLESGHFHINHHEFDLILIWFNGTSAHMGHFSA